MPWVLMDRGVNYMQRLVYTLAQGELEAKSNECIAKLYSLFCSVLLDFLWIYLTESLCTILVFEAFKQSCLYGTHHSAQLSCWGIYQYQLFTLRLCTLFTTSCSLAFRSGKCRFPLTLYRSRGQSPSRTTTGVFDNTGYHGLLYHWGQELH